MLTQTQINEIRGHLEKAQNPLFFFDNDADGLCSFLLLQKYIGIGKGIPIKTFPNLAKEYFRKIKELEPDCIFILDKPLVSEEFLDEVRQINLPVVWIDHHEVQEKIPEFVSYYNVSGEGANFPTTYLCYQVSGKAEDLWIAVAGCISDNYLPDFYEEFMERYPDLSVSSKNPTEIYYNSGIGKITLMFNFALKDRITNVINMLRFLVKSKSPYDILEESGRTFPIHKRFSEINKKYTALLEKARKEIVVDGVLFFRYGGNLSISSDLANGLKRKFPDRIIIVGYVSENKINISIRGEKIRSLALESISGFEDPTGGGHEDAVGVKIKLQDWERFREIFLEKVREKNSADKKSQQHRKD